MSVPEQRTPPPNTRFGLTEGLEPRAATTDRVGWGEVGWASSQLNVVVVYRVSRGHAPSGLEPHALQIHSPGALLMYPCRLLVNRSVGCGTDDDDDTQRWCGRSKIFCYSCRTGRRHSREALLLVVKKMQLGNCARQEDGGRFLS